MLNHSDLHESLRTDHRVTPEYITSRIQQVAFTVLDGTTVTLCNLTLDNGFSVRGESACVYEEHFDEQVGQKLAYHDALHKLWPLFGFLLAEAKYAAAKSTDAPSTDAKPNAAH